MLKWPLTSSAGETSFFLAPKSTIPILGRDCIDRTTTGHHLSQPVLLIVAESSEDIASFEIPKVNLCTQYVHDYSL